MYKAMIYGSSNSSTNSNTYGGLRSKSRCYPSFSRQNITDEASTYQTKLGQHQDYGACSLTTLDAFDLDHNIPILGCISEKLQLESDILASTQSLRKSLRPRCIIVHGNGTLFG